MLFGEEVGKEGTPHLQGMLQTAHPTSFDAVKALLGPRYHIEVCKSPMDSIVYCKKDGKFVELGKAPEDPKTQGKHGVKGAASGKIGGEMEKERWTNILELAQAGRFEEVDAQTQVLHGHKLEAVRSRFLRRQKMTDTFEQMEWHYGLTGTGKSRTSREMYPGAYIKMLNKWWDGYEDQEVVIIEDVDPVCCERMAHMFKIWTDHYPFPCEVKNNVIQIRPRKVIVTSQYTIQECFQMQVDQEALKRRFKCYRHVRYGTPLIPMCLDYPVVHAAMVLPNKPSHAQYAKDEQEVATQLVELASTQPMDETQSDEGDWGRGYTQKEIDEVKRRRFS